MQPETTLDRVKLSAIDLNVLVALDALLSERNVTRAAVCIGRSQPATSHALKRARALFKDPLLVRVKGGLELSARAKSLAPQLNRVLRELGATLEGQADFDPGAIESLSLGATDYVGFVLLPHVLRRLQAAAPRLAVHVRSLEGLDALDPVQGGALDLALGTFPQIPAGLKAETLFEDEFVCLRRRRAKASRTVSVREFARLGHVLVVSPAAGKGPVDYALARLHRERHVAAYVPHFLAAPAIVAQTDWVLTTGRRVAEHFASTLELQLFEPPVSLPPFRVSMIWHGRTEQDSVAAWLRGVVRAAARDLLDKARPRRAPQKSKVD